MTPSHDMAVAMAAINRWMFFAWNYTSVEYSYKSNFGDHELKKVVVPNFLAKINWSCNFDHMLSKWEKATLCDNPDAYLPRFYAELGLADRKSLLKWVMTHYTDEQKLMDKETLDGINDGELDEHDLAEFLGREIHYYHSWNGSTSSIKVRDVQPGSETITFGGTDSANRANSMTIPMECVKELVLHGKAETHDEIDHCDIVTRWSLK